MMARSKRHVVLALLLTLVAAPWVASADEPSTAASAKSSRASTGQDTSSTAVTRNTTTSKPPVDGASAAASSAPKIVCFHHSLRCFEANGKRTNGRDPTGLDLSAPAITHVFSEAELQRKLPDTNEADDDIRETVHVEGERQLGPVSVGLMALPWAVLHPTQAWRIFMPLPANETK